MEFQSASLEGLEPTLIRNLTDHQGNNLLHAVCYHGHVNLLPWVTRRFAGELPGALSDENRRGFTPIVYAIKVRDEQSETERLKLDEMKINIRALHLPFPKLLFHQETAG